MVKHYWIWKQDYVSARGESVNGHNKSQHGNVQINMEVPNRIVQVEPIVHSYMNSVPGEEDRFHAFTEGNAPQSYLKGT